MKTKPVIIAIVGASGSGKTTLAKHLHLMGVPYLVSFTTRPMRPGEVNGVDHYFVDDSYPIPQEPLAYTFFGGHHYWTEPGQVTSSIMSYVIDEKGLIELKKMWGDKFDILSIKIERSDNPTDLDRQARDRERIDIPDEDYDCLINNSTTLHRFLHEAIYKTGKLLSKRDLTWHQNKNTPR